MKIYIPHISYTIDVKQLESPYDRENHIKNAAAYVKKDSTHACTLFLDKTANKPDIGLLAHEVMHIVQFIASDRGIDLIAESENSAYIFGFIIGELVRIWDQN